MDKEWSDHLDRLLARPGCGEGAEAHDCPSSLQTKKGPSLITLGPFLSQNQFASIALRPLVQ